MNKIINKKVKGIFWVRNGRLAIFQRLDSNNGKRLTKNWYGRCFVGGRTKVFSSGTPNKVEARKKLEKIHDKLLFKVEHGLSIHDSSFKDLINKYLKWVATDIKKEPRTKGFINEKMKNVLKCKSFMKQNVSTLTPEIIKNTFLDWRFNQSKINNKVLSSATIKGDLTVIQGFLNWCYKEDIRKKKVSSLSRELLSKEMLRDKTRRIGFEKDEYQHLLSTSRVRVKNGHNKKVRFEREKLHQYIIFMVGTGLRVEESLSLHWEDITFVDREKERRKKDNNSLLDSMDEDLRYYLKINVRKSKTGSRETYSTASGYHALQRLLKLYKETGMGKIDGNIFQVKSVIKSLNSLLEEAKLKTKRVGDRTLTRDSKSFRNTFIQWMLDKGVPVDRIAKLCGTSTTMIERFYTSNTSLQSMLDVMLQTGRSKLRAISNQKQIA